MSDGLKDALFVPAPKELHESIKRHRDEKSYKAHDISLCPLSQCEQCRVSGLEIAKDDSLAAKTMRDIHMSVGLDEPEQVEVKSSKMTKKQYFEFHQACTEKMTAITKTKNADYTGTSDDPFANFSRVEALGICSTEQGFLTRMVDKLARINSFVQKGELQVRDESVEDTLLDLANYSILFAGYIRSKK